MYKCLRDRECGYRRVRTVEAHFHKNMRHFEPINEELEQVRKTITVKCREYDFLIHCYSLSMNHAALREARMAGLELKQLQEHETKLVDPEWTALLRSLAL